MQQNSITTLPPALQPENVDAGNTQAKMSYAVFALQMSLIKLWTMHTLWN